MESEMLNNVKQKRCALGKTLGNLTLIFSKFCEFILIKKQLFQVNLVKCYKILPVFN